MSDEINLYLWMVTWRERGKTNAWKVPDDGKYNVGQVTTFNDELGTYWQVPIYAHNRMTAVFDAAGIINKEIQRNADFDQKHFVVAGKRP